MALNPNISLAVKGVELQDPLAQYGKVMAIQSAQQQNQLAQMQMQQAEREIEERNRLREFIPGMTAQNRSQLLGYGASGRQVYESLLKGEKETREAQKAEADIAAARMKQARDLLPSVTSPDMYANWRNYTLQNLPGLAGLIPEQYSPDTVRGLMLEADKALEQHFVTQNRGGAQQVLTMPKYGSGAAQVVPGSYAADVAAPPEVVAQKAAVARAGAPTVNVSTGKKYGETFAANLADADMGKMAAAEKAPQLAESANRIIDLVKQGNVFTGPAADIKLNIARVLNVAGADNQEKIANTEALIAATGQSTLDSIKSAGLGTGQGFTDKDLKFLQGIAGGTIGLTSQTLTRLAELQYRTATRSAESWNSRLQQLPAEVLQGTGLSTAPIKVPALRSAAANVVVTPDGQSHSFPTPEAAAKFKQAAGL